MPKEFYSELKVVIPMGIEEVYFFSRSPSKNIARCHCKGEGGGGVL